MAFKFASRMDTVKASTIREILKLTEKPEVISFGGGMPAPELFPIEELKEVTLSVLDSAGQKALQYAPTDGYPPLREKIVERLNRLGIEGIDKNNILLTSGSQQGLDFSGKVFLDPGDVVICEKPSYLGAINAFKAYQCKFVDIPMDDGGMIMEDLEKALMDNPRVKYIYVIPDFQNPTGKTWSVGRRKELVDMANRYDTIIIEDNPYYELRYEGEIPPAVKSFDTEGRVVFLGTFSKTFSPGLRMGWVCANEEILMKYNLIKQGSDLQVNTLTQMQLNTYIETYDFDARIEEIKKVYRHRRDLMVQMMKENFPEDVKIFVPEGGLFVWLEFPENVNTTQLMLKALEKNVAFVPGDPFYPNGGGENTCRFSFSNMPDEKIIEGIRRMGEVIKEM
ncbi:MAG: PLP-dependent aminotransferase family protein [Bacillota bacterium]|nr:PLP-dependent aminotransferase family protein [Bacillota bacterium]